tara:strand:- start:677 stop:934 length:258 start_codon:yes stop_codon:yes gene_type:complete
VKVVLVVMVEDLLKLAQMVMSRVAPVVVAVVLVVAVEALVQQSLLHVNHTSLVEEMVAVDNLDLVVVVVTKVVVAVALWMLVVMV